MIVGVDVSSKRIDLAWISSRGTPQRWHQLLHAEHVIDRVKLIAPPWSAIEAQERDSITEVAIEYPFSNNRKTLAHLMAIVGAITRSAPMQARVAWPSSGELRAAIGAKNTKADAHDKLRRQMLVAYSSRSYIDEWDEHELDALVACIGWTRVLEAQQHE